MTTLFRKWPRRRWAAFAVGVLLAACGGGVGSGGTGTGFAQGAVSGFGSVIVDGRRFADAGTAALREDRPGVVVAANVLLGAGVEVDFGDGDVALQLRVEPLLVGTVAGIDDRGALLVLGQRVLTNSDPARGPITQFGGGYGGAGAVRPGDAVEVHGVLVPGTDGDTLQATRIERLAAAPDELRVSGRIAAATGGSLRIGTLQVDTTAALRRPAGAAFGAGAFVTLLAPAATLAGDGHGGLAVAADLLRLRQAPGGSQVSLGGAIAQLDAAARRFDLGGLTVAYGGATVTSGGKPLANGQYVRVEGQAQTDGTVHARDVTLRDGRSEPESELKGNITDLDAATRRFSLRGVAVDAGAAAIEGCPNGQLAEGLYVEVEGSTSASGVTAKSVHCEDEPSGATVERQGLASQVDNAASSFVLTSTGGAMLTVVWSTTTYFGGVTPQTLAGKRLEVEGTLVNGRLQARSIQLDH